MSGTCVDACCLINIINSGVFEAVAKSHPRDLAFQGLVEDEVLVGTNIVAPFVGAGLLKVISGDLLRASEVQEIIERYNLGAGESECIAIGRKLAWHVASDDRRARSAAARELGEDRILGSLGMLREAVSLNALSREMAYGAYLEMRRNGAFLPSVEPDFFNR